MAAAEAPAEGAEKPAGPVPPYLEPSEYDPSALLALAAAESPVVIQARSVMSIKLRDALISGDTVVFERRWLLLAKLLGELVCSACSELDKVPSEHLSEVLFLENNRGFVCAAAAAEIAGGGAKQGTITHQNDLPAGVSVDMGR